MKNALFSIVLTAFAIWAAASGVSFAAAYDVVIANGRVMDPETGLDAVRHIGIRNGAIARISRRSLRGDDIVDASGMVVAPGFIDLHAHGQHWQAQELQARDGVTTAIEMEGGAYPIEEFYSRREGSSLINFGAAVSHICIRIEIKYELTCVDVIDEISGAASNAKLYQRDPPTAFFEPLSQSELAIMLTMVASELKKGGLGVGFGIEYIPGAGRKEIYEIFNEAAKVRAPVFVHVRKRDADDAPGAPIAVAQEVIANAAVSGAPLQIVHVTSTGLGDAPVIIDMVERAQARGLDITTEAYPYTAGSTTIGSALFTGDWREAFGVNYNDLVWADTGERLTEETFLKYRKKKPGGNVVMHMIPEDVVRYAIAHPVVSIASDGMPWVTEGEHPRGAGAFARVLGRYVREQEALDLMTALRKMTLMPARRMEEFAPSFGRKGRIRVGADADVTVFDPHTIVDNATFEEPMRYSEGITHVLVGGVFVVRDGELVEGVNPGKGIRGRLAE